MLARLSRGGCILGTASPTVLQYFLLLRSGWDRIACNEAGVLLLLPLFSWLAFFLAVVAFLQGTL